MAASGSLTRRALLSGALYLGFWLLGLLLVAGLGWIPVAQARFAGGPDLAGLAAGAGALAVAWSLRPRVPLRWSRAEPPTPLAASEAPGLHDLVRRVAQRSGVQPPDELRLTARAGASIGVERWRLGLSRARVMELGLPLFAMLSRDELAAVVAHELAHERGGDVLLGAWVHRTRAALAGAVDDLEGSAFLLDAPFRAYGALFLRASGAVSRAQELAADAHAADVCGAGAAWGALHRLDALGATWTVYLHHDALPAVERGVRVPLLDGWRRFLVAPRLRPEVERGLAGAAEAPPAPGDTHPTTAARLAALDPRRRADGPRPAPAGCLELLGGEAAAEEAWYRRVLRAPLPQVGWDEVASRALLPALEADLAGGALDPGQADLARLPALVRDAEGAWEAVRRGVSLATPAARRKGGLRLIGAWLAAALRRRGFEPLARPGAELLLRRGDLEVEPWATVAALDEGRLTPEAWQAWLVACPPPAEPMS